MAAKSKASMVAVLKAKREAEGLTRKYVWVSAEGARRLAAIKPWLECEGWAGMAVTGALVLAQCRIESLKHTEGEQYAEVIAPRFEPMLANARKLLGADDGES